MEHHPTWIGNIFNALFGGIVGPLLGAVGIHPHDPGRPIPDHIAVEIFIVLLCIPFFLWFRKRLSADNPGGMQLAFEQLLSNDFQVGIYDLLDEIIGPGGRKHLAAIGSIGLFVLLCNFISLIPNTLSPTAVHTVPLGCALAVFVYYNVEGVKAHGPLGYGKQFLGPVLPMAPLMLPIEIISHLARLLSLTVRLWANMVVSETLYLTFLGLGLGAMAAAGEVEGVLGYILWPLSLLLPLILPVIFVGLHVFVAFLQAFVFTLLPIVYVGGAVAEEH